MRFSSFRKGLLAAVLAGGMLLLTEGTALADVPDPVDAPAITATAETNIIEGQRLSDVNPADGKEMVNVEYYRINLDGRGLSAGNIAKLNDINALYNQLANKKRKEYLDAARKAVSGEQGLPEMLPYTLVMKPSVIMADETGLSVLTYYDAFMGGAHNNYWYGGMNFDAQGNPLKLTDICTDIHKLCEALKKEIRKNGFDRYCFNLDNSFTKIDNENGKDLVFVRNSEAVYFYFSPYRIAPYSAGYHVVKLEYAKYKKLLKKI